MITLENTKTVYDLVKNGGKECGNKSFLRYKENDVILIPTLLIIHSVVQKKKISFYQIKRKS